MHKSITICGAPFRPPFLERVVLPLEGGVPWPILLTTACSHLLHTPAYKRVNMQDSRFSGKVGDSPCNHTTSELIVMRLNYRATSWFSFLSFLAVV